MAKYRLEDMKHEMANCLASASQKLQSIWDEIGICEEQRQDRTQVVVLHLNNLLEEMVKEEEALKTKLMANVEIFGQDLLKLCQELALPTHEPEEGLSILELEKDLRTRVDNLMKEKHDRLKKLKKMKKIDQHLCDILCTTPYYIPSGSVPSNVQLQELEQQIARLTDEKERRYNVYKTTRDKIIKLLEELDQCPNTSFERDIVCEEQDSFLLTTENMKALKIYHEQLEKKQHENFAWAAKLRDRVTSLWNRLQVTEEERSEFTTKHTGFKPKTIDALRDEIARLEVLKVKNMRQVLDATRHELVTWWNKVYYSTEQRQAFAPFYEDDPEMCTEELLELHDKEVAKIKQYYEENMDMYDRVAKRQKLWKEFLEFEKKATDPNRFSNRGCNLLKEEKARKRIMKELPKVEEEVQEDIRKWEEESGQQFLIDGVPFSDYVKIQWTEYKRQKESEKSQRHQRLAKITEEEMIYGSKPNTPAKRRFIGTPSKTPTSKSRKLNDTSKTPKTPASVSRLGHSRPNHSSIFASPACMPPRSASKTPHRLRPTQQRMKLKALADRNTSTDTDINHTAVSTSSGFISNTASCINTSNASLASVGHYQDFAAGLNNQNAGANCRSSVLPSSVMPVAF